MNTDSHGQNLVEGGSNDLMPFGFVFTQVGGQTLNILPVTGTNHRLHSGELPFCAFGLPAAEVALSAFGAHDLPGAGGSKPFGGCLVGLELILFILFLLAGHENFSPLLD